MYLTLFYFSVFINLLIFIFYLYLIIQYLRKRFFKIELPIKIIKMIIPLISNTFLLPIFFIFLSTFDCTKDGKSFYSNNLECKDTIYYINCFISIISIILFVPINFLSITIFYEFDFESSSNICSKSTSKPEVFLCFTKIFLTMIFVYFDGNEKIHILLILACNFFTFILMYLNFKYPRYNNVVLIFMHQFMSLSLWWASFILLFGKITMNIPFDGCLGIFFITEPIFCFIFFIKNVKTVNNISNILENNNSEFHFLNNIKMIMNLIKQKDNDRNSHITLKGYISLYEERCIYKKCALKKYLNSIKKGINGTIFLYHHIDELFVNGLNRFPNSIEIKFTYALFLYRKMNKTKKAKKLLELLNNSSTSFEQKFIIYRAKRYINEDLSKLNGDFSTNFDAMKELEYKNFRNQFNSLIIKASNLYNDFWSQLLISHSIGSDNLSKLNSCGGKINKTVKEINEIFEKMQNYKTNDYDVIKIYYDFINYILNNKEKGLKYKEILNEMNEFTELPKQSELEDLNINLLNLNDKYQYIIVSANDDSMGIITNFSLSITEIFGYEYDELINQDLNIIIPEIFHKGHKKVLKNKINDFKRQCEESIINKLVTKEMKVFGKNKSKYLIEVHMKITLLQTENHELYFISSLSKSSSFFHTAHISNDEPSCYILTNKNLFINNFTANAISFLGITSDLINNNVEITYFIKQFYEDFLSLVIEGKTLSSEEKLNLKTSILNKNYKKSANIIWRKINFIDSKISSGIFDFKTSLNPNNKNIDPNEFSDKKFSLSVNEVILNKKIEGYIFQFDRINIPNFRSSKMLSFIYSIPERKNSKKLSQIRTISKTNLNNVSKPNLNIEPNFIPLSSFNFKLNFNNLTYKGDEEEGSDSLRHYMKKKVIEEIKEQQIKEEKIKKEKTKKENEEKEENENEEDDENEENDDNSDDDYESSSEINDNINIENNNKVLNRGFTKIKIDDNYYKVNYSKIKFSKYDFTKHFFLEIKDWDKISQVEKVIKELNQNISENEINKKEKQKTDFINKNQEINKSTNTNNNNINNSENYLKQEIEKELTKKESQKSIVLLKQISILIFILLLGIGCISYYYIIYSSRQSKKISNIVIYTIRLYVLNSIGIYRIKELILLNNENYTSIPTRKTREEYIDLIYSRSKELFIEINELIALTCTSNYKFSKSNFDRLFNYIILVDNIQNDLTITNINTTIYGALVETSTAMYNILLKDIKKIIPTEQDTYFFIRNSLNIIAILYKKLYEIVMDELKKVIKLLEKILIIGYISFYLIIILIYFLINHTYTEIIKKKESYIEVFFKINTNIVKASLEKCEYFNYKLNNDDDEESLFFYDEQNKDSLAIQQDKYTNNNKKENSHKKNKLSRLFQIRIGIFLILIMVFFTIIFFLYYLFLNQMIINAKYFYYEILIETCFYDLYNSFREYLFDINSIVNFENSLSRLNFLLIEIYEIRKTCFVYMNNNRKYLPYNFIDKYNDIFKHQPCFFRINDYFLNDDECFEFMNGATLHGYLIMNSYFIEEIRFLKDMYENFIDVSKPINNLTLTGLKDNNEKWPLDENEIKSYISNDPIIFFNLEMFSNLNLLMSNIIIPYLDNLKRLTINSLNKYLNEEYQKYIIIIIIYICIITISFFLIWVPFVNTLNKNIYRTKNMLSIIPIEVLSSISNIDILLDMKKNTLNSDNHSK